MIEYTVSVHIERHSWLERQEAQFGYTMVIFDQFSSEYMVFLDKKWLKMTIVRNPKMTNFNRTSAFYMRGYGTSKCNKTNITFQKKGIIKYKVLKHAFLK